MKGGAEIDDYTTDVFNWFFLTEVVTQKKVKDFNIWCRKSGDSNYSYQL